MMALLYSGGLDSSALWWALGKPAALYCGGSFGPARHANLGEMDAIERQMQICPEFADKLTIRDIDFRPFMRGGEWHLPRDQVMCMLAWAAGFDGVMIGWCRDDGTTQAWADQQAARFAQCVGNDFVVTFPAVKLTKRQMVRRALRRGCPPAFLEASHSCVRQSDGHCGQCDNCVQREAALGVLA